MWLNIAGLPAGLSSGLSAVCPKFSDWNFSVKLSYRGQGFCFQQSYRSPLKL